MKEQDELKFYTLMCFVYGTIMMIIHITILLFYQELNKVIFTISIILWVGTFYVFAIMWLMEWLYSKSNSDNTQEKEDE